MKAYLFVFFLLVVAASALQQRAAPTPWSTSLGPATDGCAPIQNVTTCNNTEGCAVCTGDDPPYEPVRDFRCFNKSTGTCCGGAYGDNCDVAVCDLPSNQSCCAPLDGCDRGKPMCCPEATSCCAGGSASDCCNATETCCAGGGLSQQRSVCCPASAPVCCSGGYAAGQGPLCCGTTEGCCGDREMMICCPSSTVCCDSTQVASPSCCEEGSDCCMNGIYTGYCCPKGKCSTTSGCV